MKQYIIETRETWLHRSLVKADSLEEAFEKATINDKVILHITFIFNNLMESKLYLLGLYL